MDTDVIVVGAGLAGLVATAELADAGKKVLLLDQEGEQSLGGQAFWSLGGLFLVDTPEQRRIGIRDTHELALQDWMGSAQFDRETDHWPRRWAEAYVDFAAGEKRQWLHDQGVRIFPVVGWAERGDGRAGGHGNSVPRFHLTWGTGPGVVAPFERRVREAAERGLVTFGFRHRVDDLVVSDGVVTGVRGAVLAADGADRGRATNRDEVAEFAYAAQAVIVTSGGIGGDHDEGAPELAGRPARHRRRSGCWPACRPTSTAGCRRSPRRPAAEIINPDRMWHYTEGLRNWDADLGEPRHPDPARAVVAVAVRDGRAVPGAVPARLRHPRHAGRDPAHRLRLLLVRAHAEDHREGVRAVGVGAEPRPHRQGHPAHRCRG